MGREEWAAQWEEVTPTLKIPHLSCSLKEVTVSSNCLDSRASKAKVAVPIRSPEPPCTPPETLTVAISHVDSYDGTEPAS